MKVQKEEERTMKNIEIKETRNQENYISLDIYADGILVGEAGIMLPGEDDEDQSCYLERLDIDEEHRGQGIGTEAIYKLDRMYDDLFFAPDNEDAKRLYDRIATDVSDDYWMVDQGFGVYRI